MNHENILMRNLCDTLMQNHASDENAELEAAGVDYYYAHSY